MNQYPNTPISQYPSTNTPIPQFPIPFTGHQKNWERLTAEARQNRLPAAYLFYGTPGIGKKLVAQTLVQLLFCKDVIPAPRQDRGRETRFGSPPSISARGGDDSLSVPCGKCSSCTRIAANQHPDYFLIKPDEAGSIKIDELRDLKKKIAHAPLEAALKVILIDQAHEMTHQAANSLLKILEEPPSSTLFILITPQLFRMIPTIRSRCRRLYFSPPPLLETAPDEKYRESLQALDHLAHKKNSPFAEISLETNGWIKNGADLPLLLEGLKKKLFEEMKRKGEWSQVSRIDRISQAQKDLDRNGNKALVIESLLMDLTQDSATL